MRKQKTQIPKTTKKLFKQVHDLIENKVTQSTKSSLNSQRNLSKFRIFGSEINFGTDPSISLSINTINDFLRQISLNPIIIDGLLITANTPADSYVNVSSGTALYIGKVFELQSDISNLKIPLTDNPNTEVFYIQVTNVSGGYSNISVNTSELSNSCTIGIIKIPVAGSATVVIDQKDYDNTTNDAYIDNRQQDFLYSDGLGKLQETSIDLFRDNNNLGSMLVNNDIWGIWFKDINDVSRGYIRGTTDGINIIGDVIVGASGTQYDVKFWGDNEDNYALWSPYEIYSGSTTDCFQVVGDYTNLILPQGAYEHYCVGGNPTLFRLSRGAFLFGSGLQGQIGCETNGSLIINNYSDYYYSNIILSGTNKDNNGNDGYSMGVMFSSINRANGYAHFSPVLFPDISSSTVDDTYVFNLGMSLSGGTDLRWNKTFLNKIVFDIAPVWDSEDTYIDGGTENTLVYSAPIGHSFTSGTENTDVTVNFIGTTNSGVFYWMEDEDYFKYSDDILLNTTEKLYFRDTDNSISSADDSHLDIIAKTYLDFIINSVETSIASISTGTSDNDKLVTQGYVDDAIESVIELENFWDRESSGILVPHTPNDSINIGSGSFTTTEIITGGTITDGTFSVTAGAITGASGSNSMWTNDEGYISDIVEDTTPQLGGDLDGQSTYDLTNIVDYTGTGLNTWGSGTYTNLGRFANQDEEPIILKAIRGASGTYVTTEEPFLRCQHWVQTSTGDGGTPATNHRLGYDFETVMGADQTGHYTGFMHYGLNYGPNRGDFVSIGSQILAAGDRTDLGTGTDGDTGWAFWGYVKNNGYNAGGVGMELDCVNTYGDMDDDGSAPWMQGLRLSTEDSSYTCSRAITVTGNFDTDKGWDTGISLGGWETTGLKITKQTYGGYTGIDMGTTDILNMRDMTGTGTITLTKANEANIISLRSGAAGSYIGSTWGRTGTELTVAIAAGYEQFFTNAVAGDSVIRQESTGARMLIGLGVGQSSWLLNSTNNYSYKPIYVENAGLVYNYRGTGGSAGSVGYRLYNGGETAEWEMRQPSSSDHNYYISKKVGANYSDYFKIGTDGKTYFYGDSDFGDFDIHSIDSLYGVDDQVYIDMGADGNIDIVADTNIDLNSPTITFANATKPVKSIYLSAAGATLPTSSYAEIQDFAGTNFTYRVLAFDQSSDEKCYWHFPIPDNFTGTTVAITVYWTADAGTATRGVSWKFDSGGFANDEAFKTGALGGTEIEVEDAMIATGDMHIATSGAFTCDWTAGDMAVLYCYRDVDAYSGTNLDADALLIGIKIEYSMGTLGE